MHHFATASCAGPMATVVVSGAALTPTPAEAAKTSSTDAIGISHGLIVAQRDDVTRRGEKMNKQMTPAEIEVLQQSFARFVPISRKAALVEVEARPLPPPNIPAGIAPAGVTMK